jgi:TetR/AcrR family transcriptional regulator
MVDKRRRDPDRTRSALLKAAAEIFSRRGYGGARIQAIADRARVNKAMISYHFGGKAGLYEATIAHLVDDFRPRLTELRGESDQPAPHRLRRLVETIGRAFRRRPELGAIVLREHLAGGERLSAETMARHVGEFFLTTRSILEDGMARGELRSVDPHAFHLTLIGGLVFFLASEPYRARAEEAGELPAPALRFDDYLDHLVRLLIDGLRPDPGLQSKKEKRQ